MNLPGKKIFLSLFIFSILSGCAAFPTKKPENFWARLDGIKLGEIIRTDTGKPMSFSAFIQQASKSRIVYVGELHTNHQDHEAQLKVLQGLHAVKPVVLAMEMLPREKQPIVDRFSRGELNEQRFLKEVDWHTVWGYPFELYQNILLFAQSQKIPILALNAPPEIVRKVGREGFASLTMEERQRIPVEEIPRGNALHRQLLEEQFRHHGQYGIQSFESFYEAQLTREKTMAISLAQALIHYGGGVTIVALMGKGHMTHGLGVPKWTASMLPHTYKIISPIPIDYPRSVVDSNLGDYVWITDKATFHHHRNRI